MDTLGSHGGFEAQGSRLKVQGSRFKARGSRLEAQGSRFEALGSRFEVLTRRLQPAFAGLRRYFLPPHPDVGKPDIYDLTHTFP